MALPTRYASYDQYFEEVISFLNSYNFLVKYANIEILSKKVFSEFPVQWTDYIAGLSFKQILQIHCEDSTPLSSFFQRLSFLTPHFNDDWLNVIQKERRDKVFTSIVPKLNLKKEHEITQLSILINDKISLSGVNHVIDIGSGLGYLCQLLHSKFNINVLGLEADANRVETSMNRQNKHYGSSKNNVKYKQHFVTEKSNAFLECSFGESFGHDKDFYIVGLHACADLSVNAIKLFTNIQQCRGLIIMPCCYHRMALKMPSNDTDNVKKKRFLNFPISECLKRHCIDILQRPFMRLACQRAQAGWFHSIEGDFEKRIFHLMCRAVLEQYADKENGYLVKHGKRKIFSKTSDKQDFITFLDVAVSQFKIKRRELDNNFDENNELKNIIQQGSSSSCNDELLELDKQKILDIWTELSPLDFKLAMVYTFLQDALQIVCENIVLLDKLAYVKEQNFEIKNLSYIKITDETISPRCLALTIEK